MTALLRSKLLLYVHLVRLDRPIGILLLLWPTWWALWFASDGAPSWDLLAIFTAGTVLMRSAGCAINDWADRDFDRHVERTRNRVLTSGRIQAWEAIAIAAVLMLLSFALILPLNALTRWLSVAAVGIAATYPFFKRFFAMPQAYLGIAFGCGIPMAYAAVQDRVPAQGWILLLANVFWALAYDTEYAMVDRDDDLKIGIRTSAITLGRFDVAGVMACYAATLAIIGALGRDAGLGWPFAAGLAAAAGCALYHHRLIRGRDRDGCFRAFMHNNWLGAMIWIGIAADYALR